MDTTTRGIVGGGASSGRPPAGAGRSRPAGRRDQRRPGGGAGPSGAGAGARSGPAGAGPRPAGPAAARPARSRPGGPGAAQPAARTRPAGPAAAQAARTRPPGPAAEQPARGRPAAAQAARSRPGGPHVHPLGPHVWFAERILAVVSGQRPVHSLLGLTVGEAYDQLAELAPVGPLRERLRPVLRHCGRFHPGPGVIEAFARVVTGERVSAMAFRLEQGADLRWRCAAVEIQGQRPWGSSRAAVVS
ncbi:Rv3235 family protein [Streptomyces sp. NPDC001674]|uniref:Rv3235 family protein n=1 Tax=Streptomyces sp. NPDC001674 TaxID=3154394 RepID=UPI00332CB07B